MFCLAGISIFILFQGCYTLIKHPERYYYRDSTSSSYTQSSDTCMVEGIVRFIVGASTREMHNPAGYILDNFFWLQNPPPINFRNVFIESNIGRAYLNKYVRIKGTFLTPFSTFYNSKENMSVSIKVSEIEIIKQ